VTGWVKVRWTRGRGPEARVTAGLVLEERKVRTISRTELSRMWPVWEAPAMRRLEISPAYPTQEEAVGHDFGDP